MRPYGRCFSEGLFYIISDISDSCERCHRFDRYCNLNPSFKKIAKLFCEANKLDEQILKIKAKNLRLRKQRRLLIKKLRELSDREAQNITKLEKNEE